VFLLIFALYKPSKQQYILEKAIGRDGGNNDHKDSKNGSDTNQKHQYFSFVFLLLFACISIVDFDINDVLFFVNLTIRERKVVGRNLVIVHVRGYQYRSMLLL
jgi:hypothetical protein